MKHLILIVLCLIASIATAQNESQDITTSETVEKGDHDHRVASEEMIATSDHQDGDNHGDGNDHGDGDNHEDGNETGLVELSEQSAKLAGITISRIEPQAFMESISAPGEVQLNQYSSADVTSLVDAVVVKRHAQLGDAVTKNQSLVTLASVEVAQAQGALKIAASEWRRAGKLGKSTIGAKRYTEAEVAYQQARLTLSAYGLDAAQISAVSSNKSIGTLGQFNLTAPLPGTILRDDFRIGQHIDAGQRLFLLADESQIWIKANLSPSRASTIKLGAAVQVSMGDHWHDGEVIQKHHLLDEQTRTVPIRIAVNPAGEHHHPGEFVQVSISLLNPDEGAKTVVSSLVVDESALIQNENKEWTVFVEEKKGHFRQTVISRGASRGAQVAISGIPVGTKVVTQGAFFLASELAKGGFDIHNH